MHSAESPPLNTVLPELDFDSLHDPSNGDGAHRRPYRSSGKDTQFRDAPSRSDKLSLSRRVARGVAFFLFAVLVGVGGTLACQSYRDEITQVFPPLGWLLPVSTTLPAPAVTPAELQEQLKPVAMDLAIVRRSIEQLSNNQDQLARKEDQTAQAIATLQVAEQDISQKILALAPPAPKAAHATPPKPLNLQGGKLAHGP